MDFSSDDNKSGLLGSKETLTRELPCFRAAGFLLSHAWNKQYFLCKLSIAWSYLCSGCDLIWLQKLSGVRPGQNLAGTPQGKKEGL